MPLIIRWPLVGGTRPRSVARGGQDRQRTRSCRPSRGDADVGQGQASARGFCLGLPSQHLTGASRTDRSRGGLRQSAAASPTSNGRLPAGTPSARRNRASAWRGAPQPYDHRPAVRPSSRSPTTVGPTATELARARRDRTGAGGRARSTGEGGGGGRGPGGLGAPGRATASAGCRRCALLHPGIKSGRGYS
jgi:hypothetical protein